MGCYRRNKLLLLLPILQAPADGDTHNCEDIIILMGGRQVCFNFQKAIGRHRSVGLYELWTESGVCCKHHRRRGPLLAYEALWRIKWQMIETWLSGYGHKDEVNVTNLPKICTNCSGRKWLSHSRTTLQCSGTTVKCPEELACCKTHDEV